MAPVHGTVHEPGPEATAPARCPGSDGKPHWISGPRCQRQELRSHHPPSKLGGGELQASRVLLQSRILHTQGVRGTPQCRHNEPTPMRAQPSGLSLLNRIARVLLCLVFIHAVIGKLTGFTGVAGAIAAKGLPLAPLLLGIAMALMAVGSVLVISGWKARLGAVLLLVFLVPTTLLFHADVIDSGERIQLLKNLAIMGGLLLVADQHNKA